MVAFKSVEKSHFLFLVKNYTSLTQEEAGELVSITRTFPYSQVLHNLCSRAAQDLQLGSKESLLHASAIYTTERAVLKSVMTARRSERAVEVPPGQQLPVEVLEIDLPKVQEVNTPAKPESTVSTDTLRDDLAIDIKRLKAAMSNFEQTVEALDRGEIPVPLPLEETKKKIRKTTENEPMDSLIEEIKTTKKKVKPEGPKQKEQIEIIENFIKTQPTITKNKLNSTPVDDSDLAEKSLMFGDNIVSETLVEILLKQGKKDKAIEVLKKLIWKIPQKKAYFAAQIEELKK